MNNPADRRMELINMGCRVNWAEMDRLRRQGLEDGYLHVSEGETADLVVINTCSVTGESERQARQLIRGVIRRNPQAKVVVTGCYAERDPEALSRIAGVDLVVGNAQKSAIMELVRFGQDKEEAFEFADTPAMEGGVERVRVFLHVQNGCSQCCTFCVIPPLRGPSRSLPVEQVLDQARGHLAAGFKELVLSGINLGAYGRDLMPASSLALLTEALLGMPGLERLRLSSLDPADLEPELIQLFGKSTVLCNHLHLSVQSGDDLILKRMGRHCDRTTVLGRVEQVRKVRPDMIFGADFIVGFPTESEEAFQHTLDLVLEGGFSLLHVFPYSDRPGTPAAAIPPRFRVSREVVRQRSLKLRQAGRKNLLILLQNLINQEVEILVESVDQEGGTGKTSGFLSVCCQGLEEAWIGRMLKCRVVGWDESSGLAKAVANIFGGCG